MIYIVDGNLDKDQDLTPEKVSGPRVRNRPSNGDTDNDNPQPSQLKMRLRRMQLELAMRGLMGHSKFVAGCRAGAIRR